MMKKRDEIHLWQRFSNLNEQQDDNPHYLSLADDLNIPYKRARYIALKWAREDLIDCGVSWRACWITPLGEHAEIGLYGFEYDSDPSGYKYGY